MPVLRWLEEPEPHPLNPTAPVTSIPIDKLPEGLQPYAWTLLVIFGFAMLALSLWGSYSWVATVAVERKVRREKARRRLERLTSKRGPKALE